MQHVAALWLVEASTQNPVWRRARKHFHNFHLCAYAHGLHSVFFGATSHALFEVVTSATYYYTYANVSAAQLESIGKPSSAFAQTFP